MKSIEIGDVDMDARDVGAYIPITPRETFIKDVYSSADKANACGLDRLRREEGVVPSCELGCCHCCRFHIPANVAEAHTLAQYVKREFSVEQINDLQTRTRQWHAWDNSRPGRRLSAPVDEQADLSDYEHCCPLLVDGACTVYPVRPVVCREHFVSSDPRDCDAATDPLSTQPPPVALASVVRSTGPFSRAIREHIQDEGLDYSRSIMLLPHWLAIQMEWDFALLR